MRDGAWTISAGRLTATEGGPILPTWNGGSLPSKTILSEIKADLKRLITDVTEMKRDMLGMKLDVAEIKGRLSQTPTTIQLISLVFGIMAAAFAVLKFTGHP